MIKVITSTQNILIKNIVNLQQKAKERKAQNLIVIEGVKEIGMAVTAGFSIKTVLFCPAYINLESIKNIFEKVFDKLDIIEINEDVFNKIAYRETSGGLIVLAEPKQQNISDLNVKDNGLFIILETVEKPGNLGAILRTADAAKIDGVIICDPQTDIFNPNVIRSSIGCIFTTNLITATSDEVFDWLSKYKITSYAAALTATEFYHHIDFTSSCAIVMGTESTGLSSKWLERADKQIKIPMRGEIDSLNVSTSTAIIVFEAMRQREFIL